MIQSQRQLEERQNKQNKMFGIIAHELRTPVALNMMIEEQRSQSGEISASHMLYSSSHLLSVIDDLRVAINPDLQVDIRTAHFHINGLIMEVEQQMAPLLKESGMKFTLETPRLLHDRFLGDVYRSRSVLTNLVRNVCFHSEGSQVWLSTSLRQGIDSEHKVLCVHVEDDGEGIPDNMIERVFEPFERGQTSAGGTGVGLHIVRSWLTLMGGRSVTWPAATVVRVSKLACPSRGSPKSALKLSSLVASRC